MAILDDLRIVLKEVYEIVRPALNTTSQLGKDLRENKSSPTPTIRFRESGKGNKKRNVLKEFHDADAGKVFLQDGMIQPNLVQVC